MNFPALKVPRSNFKKAGISKLFFLFFTLSLYNPGFNNSPFFCSEFQSVSRIVKIVYSWLLHPKIIFFFQTGRLDTFHNYTFSRFWNIVCCTETFSALLSSKIWQLIHKTRYWAFIRTVMAILLHKVVSQNLRVMDSVL